MSTRDDADAGAMGFRSSEDLVQWQQAQPRKPMSTEADDLVKLRQEAIEQWEAIERHIDNSGYSNDFPSDKLDELLYRSRIAAQKAAEVDAPSETGWLVEHSGKIGEADMGPPSWLKFEHQRWSYTQDSAAAMRFARREDAEAMLSFQLGRDPSDWYAEMHSVTEHQWIAAASPAEPGGRS